MGEKIEVVLPPEVLDRVDWFIELLGFKNRDKFVEAAVRRLVDQYLLILSRSSRLNGRG